MYCLQSTNQESNVVSTVALLSALCGNNPRDINCLGDIHVPSLTLPHHLKSHAFLWILSSKPV